MVLGPPTRTALGFRDLILAPFYAVPYRVEVLRTRVSPNSVGVP